MSISELGQVTASHFCAGLEVRDGFVRVAAPIIKYMMGWSRERVMQYCAQKGWKLTWRPI